MRFEEAMERLSGRSIPERIDKRRSPVSPPHGTAVLRL